MGVNNEDQFSKTYQVKRPLSDENFEGIKIKMIYFEGEKKYLTLESIYVHNF